MIKGVWIQFACPSRSTLEFGPDISNDPASRANTKKLNPVCSLIPLAVMSGVSTKIEKIFRSSSFSMPFSMPFSPLELVSPFSCTAMEIQTIHFIKSDILQAPAAPACFTRSSFFSVIPLRAYTGIRISLQNCSRVSVPFAGAPGLQAVSYTHLIRIAGRSKVFHLLPFNQPVTAVI